jgi:hypothetical protein
MDVLKKIAKLTGERAKKFYNTLLDRCNDRAWCKDHEVDYINPDFDIIMNIVYEEEVNSNLPYNEISGMYADLPNYLKQFPVEYLE